MNYAKEVKRLRLKEGLTQSELARKAKLMPQNIHNIETGDRKITEKMFIRILRAIGYTVEKKIKKIATKFG